MALHAIIQIEFIGGPIDGYTEMTVNPLERFLGVATLPVNESNRLFAVLVRVFWRYKPTATVPLAVYELVDHDESRPAYRYLGTYAVTRQQLQKGCGLGRVVQWFSKTAP